MWKRILFFVLSFALIVSSTCYAHKLLNSDWDYLGRGFYDSGSPENEIYCNRKSVRQYNNGSVRVVACFYYPPNNVMSKDELYLLYDFEINGYKRAYFMHNFEIVLSDGKRLGEGVPRQNFGWQSFSPGSVHQKIFERYYRR